MLGSSGVSCTGSSVNSGGKFAKSRSLSNLGRYGGGSCFCSRSSHSMVCGKRNLRWSYILYRTTLKKGWVIISINPESLWQPKRSAGFLFRNPERTDDARKNKELKKLTLKDRSCLDRQWSWDPNSFLQDDLERERSWESNKVSSSIVCYRVRKLQIRGFILIFILWFA